MGKKSGGDGGAAAITQAQDRATAELRQGKQEGYGFLDKAQQEALQYITPLLQPSSQIMQTSMGKLADFDTLAQQEAQKAQQAYLAPAQRAMKDKLSNLYASAGVGGRTGSRFQNMMVRNADELSQNEALRQYQLEQQTRQDLLGELGQRYQLGSQPVMYQSGLATDLGKARANTAVGTGTQLANTYMQAGGQLAAAQQQAQASKQAGKGGIGSLLGTGIGAAASIFGGKK